MLRVACCVFILVIGGMLTGCANIPAARTPIGPIFTATPTVAAQATPTLAVTESSEVVIPTLASSLTPTFAPSPSPSPTAVPDSGWQLIRPGREERTINLFDEEGRVQETVFIVRLDQTNYRFDVAYTPGEPKVLRDWQTETGAEIVMNGGYFTEEYEATGRIIVNGEGFGSSYVDFAGMVAISDTDTELRWLEQRPYDPNEPLTAGLQSFPILVKPGGQLGFPAEADNGQRARRTAIGQDSSGRILLIVAPHGRFTLHEFSRFLTESDLGLDIAINLDGGPSTGLLTDTANQGYPPFVALPAVITVYQR